MKQQLIIITLLVVLFTPGIAASSPASQSRQEVTLAISVGFGGQYRAGYWTPIQVSATNDAGYNVDGELRVRTQDTGGLAETTYRLPLYLAEGDTKPAFLYVSLDRGTTEVQVELVDQDGQIAGRQSVNVHQARRGDVLHAVVTDVPAVDLRSATPGTGNTSQVEWRFSDIPPLAEALAGLDTMLIFSADPGTGVLQADRVTAISNWVLGGGHLIVAGGDHWQETANVLGELLPVEPTGEYQTPSLAPLAQYLGLPTDPVAASISVIHSTPKPEATILLEIAGVPLVARRSYGNGFVDFVAVNPDEEPLKSWTELDRLWYSLLASTGQQTSWTRGFHDWSAAGAATRTTSNTVLPTFLQLCGFLALYIVLVGPVNYLVLRRLNRRELAWFTIPVLIVAFSVLAYSVGFNLRGDVAIVNRLNVVEVWPDVDQAQVKTLVGVQSPRRRTYDITVEEGYTLRALPEEGTGLQVPTTITQGARYLANDVPIDAGTVGSFSATGFIPAPHLTAKATWHLGQGTPRVSGELTNTLDFALENAVLLVNGDSQDVGTIQPGETISFNMSIGPPDPAPLTLGNPLNQYTLNSSYQGGVYGYGSCFSYSGLRLTVPQVMRNQQFVCGTNVSDREQSIRQQYQLLGALIEDRDFTGGRGMGVYLFAWSDTTLVDIELSGRTQQEEDTTLYIFELPVTVSSGRSAMLPVLPGIALTPSTGAMWGVLNASQLLPVEVPPSLTTWTVIERDNPNTRTSEVPAKIRIEDDDQVAFQFAPLPDAQLALVGELLVHFQAQGPLQLELWNWDIQAWILMDLDDRSETVSIPDPAPYLGPGNAVNVRVRPEGVGSFYRQIDHIKVAYRGWLAG
ncbi:MAG: hypothetical protein GYB65_20035 [Chloroflexi bacterium]|nr:hypothetical protein [Chloroflexota bacterium]